MCILFLYVNRSPDRGQYRLILATNRDEYYQRPAKQAHRWPEAQHVIAGKDLESGREGGTWFGVSVQGQQLRAGALLNVTGEPRQPGVTGRGCIVTDYLRGDQCAEAYVTALRSDVRTFNAYSFVAIELGLSDTVHWYTNVTGEQRTQTASDADSTVWFSCGNSLQHEPLVKVCAGADRFQSTVEKLNTVRQRDALVAGLTALLKWNVKHLPDPVLERRVPSDDVREQLSSVFVRIPAAGYGTRTHSLLLVDADGGVEFLEDTMCCPPQDVAQPTWMQCQHQAHL